VSACSASCGAAPAAEAADSDMLRPPRRESLGAEDLYTEPLLRTVPGGGLMSLTDRRGCWSIEGGSNRSKP
jgi:hypothetical protein